MTAQIIFICIIVLLVLNFIFDTVLNYLNHKSAGAKVGEELKGLYDEEKYNKSVEYNAVRYRFSLVSSVLGIVVLLGAFYFDFFSKLDAFVRTHTQNEVVVSLLFFALLALVADVLSTPLSLYNIFVIEQKFGFNKITLKVYIADKIKSYALAVILGGGILYLIISIYMSFADWFWLLAWAALTLVSLITVMFYASVILPLFNKLKPLEEGELRSEIESYCQKQGYALNNLFVMDGSKRSTKANAFFSGLGRKKKIVLFDTLIQKLTVQEVTAVLAHEIGHYKKKHTLSQIILSSFQMLLMFFILGWMMQSNLLSQALHVEKHSFHIAVMVFFLLYSPVSLLISLLNNMLSRKNEYEADAFAKETYNGKDLGEALKKLSVDSLSNLNPHPFYVFVHYSHPTLLQRLRKLK
jgi:STE24 endopeptidase